MGRELSGRWLCEAKYSIPGNEMLGSSGAISPAEDPAVPAKQSHKPGAEGR
ncbi:hypothetical protein HMPREF1545_00176 [Oscillibacter sp. KLE 1728]|nr:hypothetical protein HMPREF1545_00176 [Oscillibacter sp. KLE 1728]ERK68236.1 hypothetical protein HMPREF1546_00191 [Oscillibacter sp. KLE 1745]